MKNLFLFIILGRTQYFAAEYAVGDIVGEYEVLLVVGRGSFGCVYLCRHVETGERKALKAFFHGGEKVFFFFFFLPILNLSLNIFLARTF
jgi:hypothetical protein